MSSASIITNKNNFHMKSNILLSNFWSILKLHSFFSLALCHVENSISVSQSYDTNLLFHSFGLWKLLFIAVRKTQGHRHRPIDSLALQIWFRGDIGINSLETKKNLCYYLVQTAESMNCLCSSYLFKSPNELQFFKRLNLMN